MTVLLALTLAAADLRFRAIPGYAFVVMAGLAFPHPNLYGAVCGLVLMAVTDRILRIDGLTVGSGDFPAAFVVGLHLGSQAPLLLATAMVACLLTRTVLGVRSVAVMPYLAAMLI